MQFHRYRSVWEHEELLGRLGRIRHVALDMDGTIYMGGSLFPWTGAFLSELRELGIGYSFLTNNPSKSIADYLAKLASLGIAATREEMYTTTLATIDYLREHYPAARRLFLLGTPSMVSEFEAAGYVPTADSADDVPDAVVAAFDMTLEYSRLCRAAWWAKQGLPYIATNPDRVCPTDLPTVLVDCGSICAAIEHATGRRPDVTLGKPDPNMLSGILARHGLRPEQIAMVATASTPTSKWPATPGRWACWCSRARRRSTSPRRPSTGPISSPNTSARWANCSAKPAGCSPERRRRRRNGSRTSHNRQSGARSAYSAIRNTESSGAVYSG